MLGTLRSGDMKRKVQQFRLRAFEPNVHTPSLVWTEHPLAVHCSNEGDGIA